MLTGPPRPQENPVTPTFRIELLNEEEERERGNAEVKGVTRQGV